MAEIELDFELDGLGTLDDDMDIFWERLRFRIKEAALQVQGAMANALIERINIDVYEAYQPKVYPRRKDNRQFGVPLDSVLYMDSLGPTDRTTDPHDLNIAFGLDYNPRGEHSGTTADLPSSSPYYDAIHPEPLKPNPVHENELIKRIETGEGYDWDVPPKLKARPFWQKFVNEMVDEGAMGAALREAFISVGLADIEMTYDEIEREPKDGDY